MIPTTPHDALQRLRDALRDGDPERARDAAAPLLARCFDPLLKRCDRLVAGAGRPLGIDGADLALDAWAAALRRLAGDGPPIRDPDHLLRLLYRIARNRFLDALHRRRRHPLIELDAPSLNAMDTGGGPTLGECLVARERAEGDLFLGADTPLLALVAALFESDDAFRQAARRPVRRATRHYRALVLFHLGELLRAEACDDGIALVRRYALLLGVPPDLWHPLEAAARTPDSDLIAAVNRLCGSAIPDRATLSVLRYELGRLTLPRSAGTGRYNTA